MTMPIFPLTRQSNDKCCRNVTTTPPYIRSLHKAHAYFLESPKRRAHVRNVVVFCPFVCVGLAWGIGGNRKLAS